MLQIIQHCLKFNVYVPVIIAYKYTAYNLNIGTDTDIDVNIGATLFVANDDC